MLKVLTLNTWNVQGPWEKRWEVIFDGIRKYSPDLIGFQELFDAEWAEYAAKKMKMASCYFAFSEAGNVIYSRFPLSGCEYRKISIQSPTETYWRYLVYSQARIQGQRIHFLNTHLSWKIPESAVRQKQVAEILSFLDAKTEGETVLMTGDFNAVPDSREIQMVRDAGFADTFAQAGGEPDEWTWDNRNSYAAGAHHGMPDRRIDYIFVRSAQGVMRRLAGSSIIYTEPKDGVYASDHYGVLTVFED